MEVYEIKATLPRSNPLLLRQFTMDGERKLLEVGQTLQILLGWEEMWPCSFLDGGRVILPETALKAAFAGRDGFICALGAKGKQKNIWEFRLKLIGKTEQEQDYPRLVRYRGENLPQDVISIKQCNTLQQNWCGTQRMYFNEFCNEHPIEKFRFDSRAADRTLRKRFSKSLAAKPGRPAIELDYKNAVNLEELLDRESVEQLRNVGAALGIRIPSGLRKRELVACLAGQMKKEETLDGLLQSMTLNQYRAFRKICAGQGFTAESGAMREVSQRLTECCYINKEMYSFYGDSLPVECTRELLDAYDDWLETTDEAQYLRLALLRSTIVGCVRLYGCIGKASWKHVAPRSAKKSYTEEEMNAAWEEMWENSLAEDLVPGNENLIYGMDKLKPAQAEKAAVRLAGMELYVPTISEIRQLETGGLLYPDPRGRELEQFLRTECRYSVETARQVHSDIYASFQFGIEPDEYAEWIAPRLGLRGRGKLEKLKKLFRMVEPATRKAGYGGYTQLEMERMGRCIQ